MMAAVISKQILVNINLLLSMNAPNRIQHVRFLSEEINFVPRHRAVKPSDIDCFHHYLESHNKILVLTGAGLSTESGIPDYRSKDVGLYDRSNHKPTQYQEFMKSAYHRKRYWARSYIGWYRYRNFQPSFAMKYLATNLADKVEIVTQNVDGLHRKAGSEKIVELHGSLHRVKCLQCDDISSREDLQERLAQQNSRLSSVFKTLRPDGDVDISEEQVSSFQTADCLQCGGTLKPDIVFFGDNVHPKTVAHVEKMVEGCDSLLVLGSSLTVYSSYRIIAKAYGLQKYIFMVNIGPTRGDNLVNIKLEVKIGDVFEGLLAV